MRVRNTDVGVILIDEFEKSNATLFNFFLDVLESGRMVSSQALEIDINGFIIRKIKRQSELNPTAHIRHTLYVTKLPM